MSGPDNGRPDWHGPRGSHDRENRRGLDWRALAVVSVIWAAAIGLASGALYTWAPSLVRVLGQWW